MAADNLHLQIIKTVAYADIFDFPLTETEISHYLLGRERRNRKDLKEGIAELIQEGLLHQEANLLAFYDREKLIQKRKARHKMSKEKYKKAEKIARILSKIPTIQLIGVSGSLSMFNSKKSDDIDLFFITKENTLWISRFLVTVALLVLREKRAIKKRYAEDKICPNMFLSENVLGFGLGEQNLFIAHELAQLKVLYQKSEMHARILYANKWIKEFLPNLYLPKPKKRYGRQLWTKILLPFEKGLFLLQYRYMKKKITKEKINNDVARFHPKDRTSLILSAFNKRRRRYESLYVHEVVLAREKKKVKNSSSAPLFY